MKPNGGISGDNAILKAIDDKHADILRAAQAIYDERMKPARKKLAAARIAWKRAQEQIAAAERAWEAAQADHLAAERRHEGERAENVGEADRRRGQLRRAVAGARPVTVAAIKTMAANRKQANAAPALVADRAEARP